MCRNSSNLHNYGPNNTLSTWRNCKRTDVSVILPTSKLDLPWIDNPQINFGLHVSLHVSNVMQQLEEEKTNHILGYEIEVFSRKIWKLKDRMQERRPLKGKDQGVRVYRG